MSNLCMGGGGQFVDRAAVAEVITPNGTASWKPVPHIEVIDAPRFVFGCVRNIAFIVFFKAGF